MKLKKTYSIEVPISKEEFEKEEGDVIEAIDQVATLFGLETCLVETTKLAKEKSVQDAEA